jgi:hypothetical protein
MKKSILITLAFSLIVTLGFAQKSDKLTKEEKAEMRAYYETKVYPVKKEAHDQFMKGLSADDKSFLESKRAEKKAIHKESRTAQKELKALRKEGKEKEELKAARKTAMEPIREKQKALAVSMKPFMERNRDLIETSIAPIKDNQDMWKDDKDAMLDDFLSEEDNAKRDAKKAKKAKKSAKKPADKANKGVEKKKLSFVLWSGEMKKKQPKKKGGKGKKSKRG